MKRVPQDSAPESTHRARNAVARERLERASSPADAVEAVGEIVSQLFGSEEYALLAVDRTRTRLSLVTSFGIDPASFRDRSMAEGLIGRVARRGASFLAGRSSRLGASEEELSLSACVPIMEGGRVAGVLAIFRLLPHKRGISAGDVELLDILSVHAAPALAAPAAAPPPPSSPTATLPPPFAASSRLKSVYLYPGDAFVSDSPVELTTILGSCVAVCLWDTMLHIGGMSHYLLPASPLGQSASLRFGDAAIPALLASLERLGSRKHSVQAKLFGGAAVNASAQARGGAELGRRNVEMARRMLGDHGIRIVAEDVGGTAGRKLRFRTDDGLALVKVLGNG
ncbi:GAF domain-containing protein [Polyangium aurulentum]|uniref:GAF domain-containing protein n=1 Tax=Polyangium aurulentum TaxID=2567896 RepID=UPI00146D6CB8|nr:GAF domain-containing protein [Polyangium aurulentum]UQA56706.1 GAF domain-containing protein [Polyangium aurulentum]